jgi:hypothetical protein
MTNSTTGRVETSNSKAEDIAVDDLLEVEACLREQLQITSDPAVLQRCSTSIARSRNTWTK